MNVLPSAPPQQLYPMQELTQLNAEDFRLKKITLSVKDENGNLFNFNGSPLEFEVEIN